MKEKLQQDGWLMSIYMKEINMIPMMDVQEERKIAALAFGGDKQAQAKLVKANLRFVVTMAHKYKGHGLDVEDLISEGNFGLMHAATKFNPERNTRFITYAVWWIRHYINKAISEQGQSVRIPIGRREELSDGRWNMASLDKPLGTVGDDGATFGDIIADTNYLSPEEEFIKEAVSEDIGTAMRSLSQTEMCVIMRRFGLFGKESESLQSIGQSYGYSKERIRQIEHRALDKLEACLYGLGYVA